MSSLSEKLLQCSMCCHMMYSVGVSSVSVKEPFCTYSSGAVPSDAQSNRISSSSNRKCTTSCICAVITGGMSSTSASSSSAITRCEHDSLVLQQLHYCQIDFMWSKLFWEKRVVSSNCLEFIGRYWTTSTPTHSPTPTCTHAHIKSAN